MEHHITKAENVLRGAAAYPPHQDEYGGRRGYLLSGARFMSRGAIAAIVAGALMSAATGTELPNMETVTYTTSAAGGSPFDSASVPTVASVVMANGQTKSVWPLDVPRNVVATVTHGSSIVAMSVLVSGYDEYGAPISESLAVTATGTSKVATGKKAFKWIESYAVTAAADAEANTLNIAWGNTIGLPYRITDKNQALCMADGVPDATQTVVIADDATPSTTTGDARGTVLSSVAADGTKKFAHQIWGMDAASVSSLFGVNAAANL